MTKQLVVTDAKVFVPANKFEMSLAFYQALGWEVVGLDEGLAELRIGEYSYYLQAYYQRGWANNFMFYINVEDPQAWYEHVEKVLAQGPFGKARVKPLKKQSDGDIVTHVWDPSGFLLHFGERTDLDTSRMLQDRI